MRSKITSLRFATAALSLMLMTVLAPTSSAVLAGGGNATNDIGGYRIHIFTNSATASNFYVASGGEVEVLVVAGGGGGGGGKLNGAGAGGGGAGGLIYSSVYQVVAGNLAVQVGDGGQGGDTSGADGAPGSNSVFGPLTAFGGGYGTGGSGALGIAGGAGGSGGGAGRSASGGLGTNSQGNAGGDNIDGAPYRGGGGGGAGAAGAEGKVGGGGGGNGLAYTIRDGSPVYYAAGGGGGAYEAAGGSGGTGGGGNGGGNGTAGTAGTQNTGSGGGGGGSTYNTTVGAGGDGGSGIVIVRYVPDPLDGWERRAKLRFRDLPPGTLTNFPVLVVLNTNTIPGFRYADFHAPTNGADLRFAGSNTTTLLNYEIEKWDTNGNSYAWVQVPLITGTDDYIYVYWAGSVTNHPLCTTNGTVWSNGYAAVWHLREASSTNYDSTTNGNAGTPAGGVVQNAAGKIDGADQFDGSDDYVDCGNKSRLKRYGQDFTLSAWIFINAYQNSYVEAILSNRGPAAAGSLFCVRGELDATNKRKICFDTSQTGGTRMIYGSTELQLNTWHHVAVTFKYNGGNVNAAQLYVNGIREGAVSTMSDIGDPGTDATRIGWEPTPTVNYVFNGVLDEVRVADVVRASNWVYACWLNQGNSTQFLDYGVAESLIGLEVTALPATGIGSRNATLNGTLAGDGGDSTTEVVFCWGYTDGGTNSGTSAWANVISMGVGWGAGQDFATNLTGLISGSTYVYRCYATNSTGFDWSDESITFTTLTYVNAVGGNATNDIAGFRIHIFTNSATASNFVVTAGGEVSVLVVGGGGGGGGGTGAGGGAGGLIYNNALVIGAGTYTVNVGSGGAGGMNTSGMGGDGSNSVFAGLTAFGGGGGGCNANAGRAGGSGGGGGGGQPGGVATNGQGYAGGGGGVWDGNYPMAGGGGAGASGGNAISGTTPGNGGIGLSNTISGAVTWYAGGGGGGVYQTVSGGSGGLGGGGHGGKSAGAETTGGQPNTGGGGGGGGGNQTWAAGAGGSGIVIVRYQLPVIVTVSNAWPLGVTNVTLNGLLYSDGGDTNTLVAFCWDIADRGINDGTSAWANVVDLGAGWKTDQNFATNIAGLISGSTYVFRCYATNSTGSDWSDGVANFTTIYLPGVTNLGAVALRENASLKGQITDTGMDPPSAWIYWWPVAGAPTSVVAAGVQSGIFAAGITGLISGVTYTYRVLASNQAGMVWSDDKNFTTLAGPVAWHVATNGNDTAGADWATAFRTVTQALVLAATGDTIRLAGHTFGQAAQIEWTKSDLAIMGGYEATNATGPGARDPARWPTLLTRTGGSIRIMYIHNLTNATLDGVTLQGGNLASYGAGLYVGAASNLRLLNSTIQSNTAAGNTLYGGGIFSTGSSVLMSNCVVRGNLNYTSAAYDLSCGGGMYVQDNWVIRDSVIIGNTVGSGESYHSGYGGGIHFGGGNSVLFNCRVLNNDANKVLFYEYGDGLYVSGGSLAISNCTIMGNHGYGVFANGGTVTLRNTIAWNNGDDLYNVPAGNLYGCDIGNGDGLGTQGNISALPLFERGYYLATNSPCVNTGTGTVAEANLDGYTTRADGAADADAVDIGYHYPAGLQAVPDLYVSPAGDNGYSGTNWAQAFRTITKALSMAQDGSRIHVASGSYANGLESFPLSLSRPGLHLLGTNSADTVLNAAGSGARVVNVIGGGDCRIEGLTVCGGYLSTYGGGVYVSETILSMASCAITNNTVYSGGGVLYGGGIYANNSMLNMTNCVVRNNAVYSAGGYSASYGGGLFLTGPVAELLARYCVIEGNRAGVNWAGTAASGYGGGVYLDGGTHRIFNSLVINNVCDAVAYGGGQEYGDGIMTGNGVALVSNCTVAANAGWGIFNYGSTIVRDSIIWNNGDDIYNTESLYYSCIEDADMIGRNGCVSNNPEFVDTTYYHLKSKYGNYVGGYFSGGSWSTAEVQSLSIDLGDPAVESIMEPYPNGGRINQGAYGNTPAASMSHPMALTNLAPNAVTPNSATLNGQIVHLGNPSNSIWFYYGVTDGGTNAGDWQTNVYVGVFAAATNFSMPIGDLLADSNYYYTCFASNPCGATAWAVPATNFVARNTPPELRNTGVENESGPTVTLKGEVTGTGGEVPQVYIYWGSTNGGTDAGAWEHPEYVGYQSGSFTCNIATAPGSNYWYTSYAVNSYGGAWAAPALSFGHYRIRYVQAGAAGAGSGLDWSNAIPALQSALDGCTRDRTNILYLKGGPGGIFSLADTLNWTNSHVIIKGGFEGAGDPGACDPAVWTTILTRASGTMRIMNILGVTNGTLENVEIANGYSANYGAGLYIANAANLQLQTCVIRDNTTYAGSGSIYGGGIYSGGGSVVRMNGCVVRNDAVYNAGSYTASYGGGLYVADGNWTIADSLFMLNRAGVNWAGTAASGYGGGFYFAGGVHHLKNCLVLNNIVDYVAYGGGVGYGDGIYGAGGTLAVSNCTVTGNYGEGIRGGSVSVWNSIVWGNVDDIVGIGAASLYACDIGNGDGAGTQGNISRWPEFRRGFYLAPGSPCIDSGTGTVAEAGLTGYVTRTDGTQDGGIVDIGYHYTNGLQALPDLYVSPAGTNTNSGTSWEESFRTITKALSVARDGATIHVADGYYTNGLETFPLVMNKMGLYLLGTNRETTVISAAGSSARVLNILNVLGEGRLEGVTLTGGYVGSSGGGIYIQDSMLSITACAVTNNTAYPANYAGGIYCGNSRLAMSDCLVKNNWVYYNSNYQYVYGGGIFLSGNTAESTITRTVVANNRAAENWGGTAHSGYGGGLFYNEGTHLLRNSLVANNIADCVAYGGGVEQGDGIYANSNIVISNCTIAGNAGEGIRCGSPSIINTIIWNNGDDVAGTPTFRYSCVQDGDGLGSEGCTNIDPVFVDTTYYHLQSKYGNYVNGYFSGGGWELSITSSPLIDAGDPAVQPVTEPWAHGHRINMGAYGNTPVASRSRSVGFMIYVR